MEGKLDGHQHGPGRVPPERLHPRHRSFGASHPLRQQLRHIQEHRRRRKLESHKHRPDRHLCPGPGHRSFCAGQSLCRHIHGRCIQEHQWWGEVGGHQHRPELQRQRGGRRSFGADHPVRRRLSRWQHLQEHRRRKQLEDDPGDLLQARGPALILRRRRRCTPAAHPISTMNIQGSTKAPMAGQIRGRSEALSRSTPWD